MARSRNIKPGFFYNEFLSKLEPHYRLLFMGLWLLADREGRLENRPMKIKGQLFPYEDVNVAAGIEALSGARFLLCYAVDNISYIQILNWKKHQNPHHKEIASIIPAPPATLNTVCDGYIPLNPAIRERIYRRDGRKCLACGSTEKLNIDHIVPVSRGGNSVDGNLQVLCEPCNRSKRDEIKDFHKRPMDNPCLEHAWPKQGRLSPTDSLQSDSLQSDSLQLTRPHFRATHLPEVLLPYVNRDDPPDEQVKQLWNWFASQFKLATVVKLSDKRKKAIRARFAEKEFDMMMILKEIHRSDFLLGRSSDWQVDFDFVFCSANNYLKILEGKYRNKSNKGKGYRFDPEKYVKPEGVV